MRIVFVASLGHSGSTVLDLALSSARDVIGLGEIDYLIEPEKRQRHLPSAGSIHCSCGETLTDCPIWSHHVRRVRAEPTLDVATLYNGVLDIVAERYGTSTTIVDSSKSPEALNRTVAAVEGRAGDAPEIRVVHLIKDARNYVSSMRRRHRGGILWDWRWFRQWRLDNERIAGNIEKLGLPRLTMSYEELCLCRRDSADRLSDFLGIELDGFDIAEAEAHVGVGNPMRHDESKQSGIRYDDRWKRERGLSWKYRLLSRTRERNRQWVLDGVC